MPNGKVERVQLFRTKSGQAILKFQEYPDTEPEYYLITTQGFNYLNLFEKGLNQLTRPDITTMGLQRLEMTPDIIRSLNTWTLEGLKSSTAEERAQLFAPPPSPLAFLEETAAAPPPIISPGAVPSPEATDAEKLAWVAKWIALMHPVTEGAPAEPVTLDINKDYTWDEIKAVGQKEARQYMETLRDFYPDRLVALTSQEPDFFVKYSEFMSQELIPGWQAGWKTPTELAAMSPDEISDYLTTFQATDKEGFSAYKTAYDQRKWIKGISEEFVPEAGWQVDWKTPAELAAISEEDRLNYLADFKATDKEGFAAYKAAYNDLGWIQTTASGFEPSMAMKVQGRDILDRIIDPVTGNWPRAIKDSLRLALGGSANNEGEIDRQWRNYEKAWEDATGAPIPAEDYTRIFNDWVANFKVAPQLLDQIWQNYVAVDPRFAMAAPVITQVAQMTGRPLNEIYTEIYNNALEQSPAYQAQRAQAVRQITEAGGGMVPSGAGLDTAIKALMATMPEVTLSASEFANAQSTFGRAAWETLPIGQQIPSNLLPPGFFAPQGALETVGAAARQKALEATPEYQETQAEKEFSDWLRKEFPENIEERARLESWFSQVYEDYLAQPQKGIPPTREEEEAGTFGLIYLRGKRRTVRPEEYERLQALYSAFQTVPSPWVSAELMGETYMAGTPLPPGWETPDIQFRGYQGIAPAPKYEKQQPFGEYLTGLGRGFFEKLLPQKRVRAPRVRFV